MYIDSHAHLTSHDVLPHADSLIAQARDAGIDKIINICTDEPSLRAGITLQERYPFLYNAAAATPHDVETLGEEFFLHVRQAAQELQLVAIGETGLDYHYQHADRHVQQAHLLRYFALAQETKLPLIFHCRDAFSDLFALADQYYRGGPAVLHCFTGNVQEAYGVIERGWYLSVSGIVTFKKSEGLRAAIADLPLDRLLVETDTPYLAPQSKRGKTNEPSFIVETVHILAEIKGKSLEEMGQITSANAERLFSFSKQI